MAMNQTEVASGAAWADFDIGFNARYVLMRHVAGAGVIELAFGSGSTAIRFRLSPAAGVYSQEIQIELGDGVSTIRHQRTGAAASVRITAWN